MASHQLSSPSADQLKTLDPEARARHKAWTNYGTVVYCTGLSFIMYYSTSHSECEFSVVVTVSYQQQQLLTADWYELG